MDIFFRSNYIDVDVGFLIMPSNEEKVYIILGVPIYWKKEINHKIPIT